VQDAVTAPPAQPHTSFGIVADEWFDGASRHPGGACTFQVEQGVVTAITTGDNGAALKAQGLPVERVAFLMPGLVDAHVHLFLDGGSTDQATRSAHLKQTPEGLLEAARRSAHQSASCGITLVRDAGDRHGINNRVRDEAALAGSVMSQVRSGGLGIKRAKRYGAFMAGDVDDATSIRESVQRLALANDEIKLILTGIIDFDAGAVTDEPQFDIEAACLVVQTAHTAGRRVFAHCSGPKGLQVAVAAGVDCIEHGFFMSPDVLSVMRDKDLAWTPTFSPVHFQWAQPECAGWSAQTVGNLRRILDQHAEQLALAHSMGVRVLLGTDAGSMGVPHGRALWDEMLRFREAGLPVDAILAAGTSVPRRHFAHSHPVLSVGASADICALPASPFNEWRELHHPRQVWLRGLPVHSPK
jgi:imidazolonepropionase-like amidohydrolase